MRLSLVTDATVEPVSLAEMKLFLKEDLTDNDDLISSMIVSARRCLEDYAGVGMITKTYDLYLDELTNVIKIPLPPTQSISAFKVNSLTYVESSVSSSLYTTFFYKGITKSEIVKLPNSVYPSEIAPYNGVRVRFINGYGNSSTDVPNVLKTAIKLVVGHWYENRESQSIPDEAIRLIRNFKVWNL